MTAGPGVTGNGTASVTIAGTAAQINAALAGLAYTGNLDFNGADTLTVATSDGTATDTDTIAITVNAVNDAPALVVADAAYQENAAPVLLSPAARPHRRGRHRAQLRRRADHRRGRFPATATP